MFIAAFLIIFTTVFSDEQRHFKNGEHQTDYDHDAFLGKEHSHDFDDLDPEEAQRRLGLIFNKVDKSADGFVSFNELHSWINYQRSAFMRDSIDVVIHRDDENRDKRISWMEYKHAHYGKWNGDVTMDEKLRLKMEKVYRKFKCADVNKDGMLSRDEYMIFRHPEESDDDTLQEIAVEEVIDEMDTDDNRYIDLEEFLGHYTDDKETPPDWVVDDRKHFAQNLDKNGDGVLDRADMKAWIIPNKTNVIEETRHLIESCDDDNDKRLSKEEVLDHYEMFVGSTATDHGRALQYEL